MTNTGIILSILLPLRGSGGVEVKGETTAPSEERGWFIGENGGAGTYQRFADRANHCGSAVSAPFADIVLT